MVEISTVRSFRIENNDFIAVKSDKYENGKGKRIVRILEEHDISEDEIDEVINKLSGEELKRFTEEQEKLLSQMKEMRNEIKGVVHSKKFLDFKASLETDESKKFFEVRAKEKVLNAAEVKLKQLDKTIEDVAAWKQQFVSLKEKINT